MLVFLCRYDFVLFRCIDPVLKVIEHLFYKEDLMKACTEEKALDGLLPIQFYDVPGQLTEKFTFC